jgi:hypothetical protein
MDLKTKAVAAALQRDEDLYLNTRNPRRVWHAWQLARRAKGSTPDWVLRFIDRIAEHEIIPHSGRRSAALPTMIARAGRRPGTCSRATSRTCGTRVSRPRRSPQTSRLRASRSAAKSSGENNISHSVGAIFIGPMNLRGTPSVRTPRPTGREIARRRPFGTSRTSIRWAARARPRTRSPGTAHTGPRSLALAAGAGAGQASLTTASSGGSRSA